MMVWACLTCGQDIVVNPDARLGEWRYMHLEPATQDAHPAVRRPSLEPAPWERNAATLDASRMMRPNDESQADP